MATSRLVTGSLVYLLHYVYFFISWRSVLFRPEFILPCSSRLRILEFYLETFTGPRTRSFPITEIFERDEPHEDV